MVPGSTLIFSGFVRGRVRPGQVLRSRPRHWSLEATTSKGRESVGTEAQLGGRRRPRGTLGATWGRALHGRGRCRGLGDDGERGLSLTPGLGRGQLVGFRRPRGGLRGWRSQGRNALVGRTTGRQDPERRWRMVVYGVVHGDDADASKLRFGLESSASGHSDSSWARRFFTRTTYSCLKNHGIWKKN